MNVIQGHFDQGAVNLLMWEARGRTWFLQAGAHVVYFTSKTSFDSRTATLSASGCVERTVLEQYLAQVRRTGGRLLQFGTCRPYGHVEYHSASERAILARRARILGIGDEWAETELFEDAEVTENTKVPA